MDIHSSRFFVIITMYVYIVIYGDLADEEEKNNYIYWNADCRNTV